ncbi:MAG: Stp1/IreP family PP2C-type Ser/Thr phosphatase [Oscillospiraceae bacterium]|nr:Stp1/IreP family PP2C-type Ser/Thr phosphatase [Oscillospiraceae bacterium]
MKVWGVTDVGLKRRDNQDAYAFETVGALGAVVAVVCDGMGGVQGGQLASTLAVSTFLEEFRTRARAGMTVEEIQNLQSAAAARANEMIYTRAQEGEEYRGMGTTLVSALVSTEAAVLCNVGDSRAYHVGEAGIRRVTRDHSVVEEMVESGEITREEARTHPNRNLITRALGPDRNMVCDTYAVPLAAGESVLLCTDGLTGTVLDDEICDAVRGAEDGAAALERLLELAKSRGAPDNVTAILIRNDGEEVRVDG